MNQFDELSRLIGQHLLGNPAKRSDDLATQRKPLMTNSDRNLAGKVAIEPQNGYMKRHILGKIAIKVHVAIEAYTAHDSMAHVGVFPEGITKFADFLVF